MRKHTLSEYREAAKRLYQHAPRRLLSDGDIDFDDTPTVSTGDDPGAYVQAWVWVPDDEVEDD